MFFPRALVVSMPYLQAVLKTYFTDCKLVAARLSHNGDIYLLPRREKVWICIHDIMKQWGFQSVANLTERLFVCFAKSLVKIMNAFYWFTYLILWRLETHSLFFLMKAWHLAKLGVWFFQKKKCNACCSYHQTRIGWCSWKQQIIIQLFSLLRSP